MINEFFEKLQKEQVLKAKLGNRAQKSEDDIESGRVFTRAEIEERTANLYKSETNLMNVLWGFGRKVG